MRLFLVILLGLVCLHSAPAQQTAYQALRIAAKGQPDSFLDSLLVAEGLAASPQPRIWRLVFDDPSARGGTLEMEIAGGQVLSKRAPFKNPFPKSRRISLRQLQLDSDGAFTAAENEALRQKIGYDAVNFLLICETPGGNPVWRVQLLDKRDRVLTAVFINATNASIVGAGGNTAPAAKSDGESTELKIHRTLQKTGDSIQDGLKHVGGSIQEIFTGRRTIDKEPGTE